MFIFSNLATSLDGKIGTAKRDLFLLGTEEDHRQMARLRQKADGILIGATTLRSWKMPLTVSSTLKQPLNIILSSRLEGLSPRWKFFTEKSTSRLLFADEKTSKTNLRLFSKSSEVILLKSPTAKNSTAHQIIHHLEARGLSSLLVEGGGGVIWEFAKSNLIDEYHVTLTPRIIGGIHAPSLVDGTGFQSKDALKLKLRQCRIVGDEIYLTYGKTNVRKSKIST